MESGTLQADYSREPGYNGGRANWQWANSDLQLPGSPVTINVTEAGLHTLHLWQREDGLRPDRILLTTDDGYIPAGEGLPESEFE